MGAEEALKLGLVSKVFPAGQTLEEALKTAKKISSMSLPAIEMCKEVTPRTLTIDLHVASTKLMYSTDIESHF